MRAATWRWVLREPVARARLKLARAIVVLVPNNLWFLKPVLERVPDGVECIFTDDPPEAALRARLAAGQPPALVIWVGFADQDLDEARSAAPDIELQAHPLPDRTPLGCARWVASL